MEFLFTPSSLSIPIKTLYKTHLKPTFPTPLLAAKTPLVWARLGRPSKRRNSLRKKLTRDLQVRPKDHDPLHHFVDNISSNSSSNQVYDSSLGLEQGNGELGSDQIGVFDDSKQFGDMGMWNKLEGWVEQYKQDVEYWGVGSNPIFTVFRDCNGSVESVLVDKDEIFRRSGVDPVLFREDRGSLEGFNEVESKISRAECIAREVESGKDVLSENSSVAKVVVSGESAGWVGRIRSVSVPPSMLPKVTRVGGVAVVCGLVFVWVVKKLFSLGGNRNGTEVTRFEKEMLRRKMKARMERERLQKGSVEVVKEKFEAVVIDRPQLDKEELLNSIRKAKGLDNAMPVLDDPRHRETAFQSVGMDAKIQDIQIMARRARDIERRECSQGEESGSDRKLVEKDVADDSSGSVNEEILVTKASVELPATKIDIFEKQAEGEVDDGSNFSSERLTEPKVVNGVMKRGILGSQGLESGDAALNCPNVSEGNEDLEIQNFSSERRIDNSSHNSSSLLESSERVQFSDVSGSQLTSPKEGAVRRKPKIILSVKEAREYLSRKHDKKPQDNDVSATVAPSNKEINNNVSQRLVEDCKVPESFGVDGILDPDHAANNFKIDSERVGGHSAADVNGLNEETIIRSTRFGSSDVEGAEGSSSEMLGNTSETSGIVPGKNVFHEASLEEEGYVQNEESLEKVDKSDELPGPTKLVEVSDLVPDPSETSNVPSDVAFHAANLEEDACFPTEKSLDRVSETNGTPEPINMRDTCFPLSGASDLKSCGSKEIVSLPNGINHDKDFRKNHEEVQLPTAETYQGSEDGKGNIKVGSGTDEEKWLEKNFHEVEPILNKIGDGFRNNYKVAREKVKEEMDTGLDLMKLKSIKDDTEFEWMQDEKLRDIVFRVRDNELSGRDPFHSMDTEDKVAFFKGLEIKVEKENEKLSILHEWLHSNIENVDYGADGISLYDPLEKVVPRWKGPPIGKIPEFLANPSEQQEVALALRKANESLENDKIQSSQEPSTTKSRSTKVAKGSKTVIEASDGSVKPSKKTGKEYWQHTKKWSPGFVESYNAETDPEVKSAMKDMGKDLDRWMTEKELKEAAELMDKIPQRGKEIIEKKLNKLKREMELFGPAAVVSKYREYGEEKEEDYLWWLDLRYVLCIEMYTYEGDDERVGFYSLEMATDLEIDPKPHHVIAFEDPSDCKNLCYIIQAHLEMLGSGKAFVVAQPPKDVFRHAKGNGFGVTVIRKGELQLNIDQPLEEVEETITEIGSKIYHDQITRERSVDISALMKGVFGISKPSKRIRKKRARKSPNK